MNDSVSCSQYFKNAENTSDGSSLPNQTSEKKSYLVFRKNGDKLTILERPCKLKEEQSLRSSFESDIESKDSFVGDSVEIKEESCGEDSELEDDVQSLLDYSETIDFRLNDSSEKPYSSVCEICGLKFKGHNALSNHRKWKHITVVKHECNYCGRSFRDSFCLKRHLKKVHTTDGNIRDNFRSLHCFLCSFKASEGSLVVKHYNNTHGYDISEEKMWFSTLKEFMIWKKEVEGQTKSKFVKCRGSRANRNGTVVTQYNCHRSGFYNSAVKNKRVRGLKSCGSNKINGFCPASISCIEFKGQIIVKYVMTHVGHNLDVKKLGLTEDEKEFIADKLINKVPMDKILEDLTESVSNPLDKKRINLTTRKDFYNIIQKFDLKKLAVYSQFKNEWNKFDSFVEELKGKSNVVRFYKPLGKLLSDYSEFKSEDFFLIIASDEQLEMLKNYGNNCICVDNVFKININDFELYSIIILDEVRQSFPCVFIFSSRVDDNALRVYFKIIKSFVEYELCPRHFVSDWANSIYNAWTSVFKEIPGRNMFTCSHIEREWRKNLCKIKSKDKQEEVLNKIKVLLELKSFVEFEEKSKQIMKELSYSYETKFYSNYLQRFFSEPHSWAPCYRLNGEINKSLNVEELYDNIHYFLVKNKKVKCLTKTAEALLNFASMKWLQRSSISYQQALKDKINNIVARHCTSLELQESIVEVTEQGWNVTTFQDDKEHRNLVFRDDSDCTCCLICPHCSVCAHAYSCTCSDASDQFNMCQHIHLILICLQNNMLSEKEYSIHEKVLEVEVTTSNIQLEDGVSTVSNLSVLDYPENQVVGDYEIEEICEEDNITDKNETGFKAKKCEFIERLTSIVNNIETEEELDAVILQNSPLEEILQTVKEKKIEVPQVVLSERTETLLYDHEEPLLDDQVKLEPDYQDENVGEVDQIAMEVILES